VAAPGRRNAASWQIFFGFRQLVAGSFGRIPHEQQAARDHWVVPRLAVESGEAGQLVESFRRSFDQPDFARFGLDQKHIIHE
jgi:hypothetical protein